MSISHHRLPSNPSPQGFKRSQDIGPAIILSFEACNKQTPTTGSRTKSFPLSASDTVFRNTTNTIKVDKRASANAARATPLMSSSSEYSRAAKANVDAAADQQTGGTQRGKAGCIFREYGPSRGWKQYISIIHAKAM